MVKKKSVKKVVRKKESSDSKKLSREELDKLMLENFITLQKVLTNLTVKFDKLSDDIGKMLNLFEISAKSFAEKHGAGSTITKEEKAFLDKLDRVLDQNKVIAKGLTLMEERIRDRTHTPAAAPNPIDTGTKPRPLPRF